MGKLAGKKPSETPPPDNQRFDSWKEISFYLRRTPRTCYSWCNDLGLPVYRLNRKSKRSRVFAYKNEINAWFKRKSKSGARRAQGRGKTRR
jgi:hypothetical protein